MRMSGHGMLLLPAALLALVLLVPSTGAFRTAPPLRPFTVAGFDLNDYHSHADILRFLQAIQNNRTRLRSLGLSSERRHLGIVRINALDPSNAKDVFIDSGFHAREWIGVSTALHLIFNLSRSNDWPTNLNLYFVPVANPDGYEYTRSVDRDWRNTRSVLSGLSGHNCRGVDANRNFPFHWAGQGTSNDPCSEIYHGPRPLSEPEARVVAQFLAKHAGSLKGYVSLHSYHNAILVPYGFRNNARPKDYNQIFSMANRMTNAMNSIYGNNYTAINSAQLYPAAGCSDDYAKSLGIKYVYTMELTTGFYAGEYVGFETPRELIEPTYEEVRAALLTLFQEISRTA